MKDFSLTIKSSSGKFSRLDNLYRNFAIDSMWSSNQNDIDRWEIYNIIMNGLISIGKYNSFEEVKYRITDGENPNLVMLDIINKFCVDNHLFWVVKPQIESFLDEDLTNRFI